MKLNTIFPTQTNIVIGAIHVSPSPDYDSAIDFDSAKKNVLLDANAFEKGGATGIIFENNYDIPHLENVSTSTEEFLTRIGEVLVASTQLPVGISVLWNDYQTALRVAKKIGLSYIRIPVFIDTVKTSYGVFQGNPEDVIEYRSKIGAESVALFTDIHVKHAEIISKGSLIESCRKAVDRGSDALIITGKWTGDAPDLRELREVRDAIQDFPLFCGSGVDAENVSSLFEYANGAIVSTSLKEGMLIENTVNMKPYENRILEQKVRELVNAISIKKSV